LALACAPAQTPSVAPQTLYFAPAHPSRTLTVGNPGGEALRLSRIRLDTTSPDWGSFVVTDESLPKSIPAGGSVQLHIHADRKHFARETVRGQPPRYRKGHARLVFDAQERHSVDLRFEPTPGDGATPLLAKLGIFAALAGLLGLLARRLRQRVPWLLLLVIALMPWGPALCWGELGSALSPSAIDQCGAGFDGTALAMAQPTGGVLLCLLLLLLSDLIGTSLAVRGPAPASELRRGLRRLLCDLTLVIAAAAALTTSGSFVPSTLVDLQISGGWGAQNQPVAALLALLAVTLRRASSRRFDLEDLALAPILALLFLGGWALPAPASASASLPHGLVIALEILSTIVKSAALLALVRWLRAKAPAQLRGPESRLIWLLLIATLELLRQGWQSLGPLLS